MSTALVVGGGPNGLAAAISWPPKAYRSPCWRPPTKSAVGPAAAKR